MGWSEAFQNGIEKGLNRAANVGIDLRGEAADAGPAEEVIAAVIEQTDLSDRFIEMFAEMYAIAHVSRRYYNDSTLKQSEIEGYLHHSIDFFNSWRHA